ncbi:hypothetical protein F4808DRAFT_165814 [Astrocystis sublimbata]|nr:hypothetical protein F4808DRAFT_165814 [Astrocystis sublimbata]
MQGFEMQPLSTVPIADLHTLPYFSPIPRLLTNTLPFVNPKRHHRYEYCTVVLSLADNATQHNATRLFAVIPVHGDSCEHETDQAAWGSLGVVKFAATHTSGPAWVCHIQTGTQRWCAGSCVLDFWPSFGPLSISTHMCTNSVSWKNPVDEMLYQRSPIPKATSKVSIGTLEFISDHICGVRRRTYVFPHTHPRVSFLRRIGAQTVVAQLTRRARRARCCTYLHWVLRGHSTWPT